jgi:16S rRNA processing protein RimM
MVTVGRIVRPHGIRGRCVVQSETDFGDERFAVGSTLFVMRGGGIEPVRVDASRPYDHRWVVGFDGVASVEDAERMRGLDLRIPAEALRPLGAGAYYAHDLVGCAVRTMTETPVGVVERVDLGTGIPMLVVRAGGDEVLVPFSEAIVRRVSVAERLIEIDPPAGLIDLNRRTER